MTTGANSSLYLSRHLTKEIPDLTYPGYNPAMIPSIEGLLRARPTRTPTGELIGGWPTPGLPGLTERALSFGQLLSPGAHLCMLLEHLTGVGSATVTEPEAGVVHRVSFEARTSPEMIPLWSTSGIAPIESNVGHGIAFNEAVISVTGGEGVNLALAGETGHGGEMSLAEVQASNTGLGTHLPILRGRPRGTAALGDIWVEVISADPDPLVFVAYFSTAESPPLVGPNPANTHVFGLSYDNDGQGQFVAVRGTDGLQLGRLTNNDHDPIELVVAGSAAQHTAAGEFVVGDRFRFRRGGTWQPSATYDLSRQVYTFAHFTLRYKLPGDTVYRKHSATDTVTLTWSRPTTYSLQGKHKVFSPDGSPSIQLTAPSLFKDQTFNDAADELTPIDALVEWKGMEIGDPLLGRHNSVSFHFPRLLVVENPINIDTAQLKQQTGLTAYHGLGGEAPWTVSVQSTEPFTPIVL